jgi:hypothetical protein
MIVSSGTFEHVARLPRRRLGGVAGGVSSSAHDDTVRGGEKMTHYGTLRVWAAFLSIVGVLGALMAAVGTIIWAIEVEGSWETIGRLLIGGAVSVFLATASAALSQALRAIADVGETVSAR